MAFYIDEGKTCKISDIIYSASYTQNNQTIILAQTNLWSANNKYNFISDWHYIQFPQSNFGLGMNLQNNTKSIISYSNIRCYQSILKSVASNFYVGPGYSLDYRWNINETHYEGTGLSDYAKYKPESKSTSSGLTANLIYDNRINSINPTNGIDSTLIYRYTPTMLGSTRTWSSLFFDFRKYFLLSHKSGNVLAFWSYNWFVLSGTPPYLDLPGTGLDTYACTGRGYIQSRFRGMKMVDLEAEFRFNISRNQLLGGVLFSNLQSISESPSNTFKTIAPGAGAGIRFKINKYSRTNVAIDYAFGVAGARGLFLNLGECF